MNENSNIQPKSELKRQKDGEGQDEAHLLDKGSKQGREHQSYVPSSQNANERPNIEQNQNTTNQGEGPNNLEKLQKLQQWLVKPKANGPSQQPNFGEDGLQGANESIISAQGGYSQEEFEKMQQLKMQKLEGLKNLQFQHIYQLQEQFRHATLNQMMSSQPESGSQPTKILTPNFQQKTVHPQHMSNMMPQQFNSSGSNDIQFADQIKSQQQLNAGMIGHYQPRHGNVQGPFLSSANPKLNYQGQQYSGNNMEMHQRMNAGRISFGSNGSSQMISGHPNNASAPPLDGKMSAGRDSAQLGGPANNMAVNRNSLRNLKQNQNLFLSLQNKEDKIIRWKYTLLVLDNMIDQIMSPGGGFSFAQGKEFEIDFVKISESLPKLVIGSNYTGGPNADSIMAAALAIVPQTNSSSGSSKPAFKAGQKNVDQANKQPGVGEKQLTPLQALKLQKTTIQPRICSKLWESLRKSLRESFKMELEFFDHTRQEIVQNHWTESLLMFKKRIQVYYDNQDLLNFKQKDQKEAGINYVESELRAQRLIEEYCKMCERAEQVGITNRSKNNLINIGQGLKEELQKEDKITEEDEQMILQECDKLLGKNSYKYSDICNVMDKILNEVNALHQTRENQIKFQVKPNAPGGNKDKEKLVIEWTNVEIAQLLVAVYNLGEGEWYEIQKRINFSTSGVPKTPNQVAHRWRSIKRVIKRDVKEINLKNRGQKIITKHDWIIYTLKQMNMLDPQSIGLKDENFQTLHDSICVDPYAEKTPYQTIIEKYQKDQQRITQERSIHRQNLERQRRQIQIDKQQIHQNDQDVNISPPTLPQLHMASQQSGANKLMDEHIISSKQTHSQRFSIRNDEAVKTNNMAIDEDEEEIIKLENIQENNRKKQKIREGGGDIALQTQNSHQSSQKIQSSAAKNASPFSTSVIQGHNSSDRRNSQNNPLVTSQGYQKNRSIVNIQKSPADVHMSEEQKQTSAEIPVNQSLAKGGEVVTKFQDQALNTQAKRDMTVAATEKKSNISIVRQQVDKFDGGISADKVNKINQKQIQHVLDNLSGESSNHLHMSQNLKISQTGQQSSIHEVHPGKQPKSKSDKNKNQGFQERKNSAMSSNNEFSLNSNTNSHTNHQIRTSQTIKKDSQMQQQITINNNINITTICNGPSPQLSSQGVPNQIRGPQMTGNNIMSSLSQNINTVTRSASSLFGKQPGKNSNLNLLLQNPLSQIQAPLQNPQARLQQNQQQMGTPLANLLGKKKQNSNTNLPGLYKSESVQDMIRAQYIQRNSSAIPVNTQKPVIPKMGLDQISQSSLGSKFKPSLSLTSSQLIENQQQAISNIQQMNRYNSMHVTRPPHAMANTIRQHPNQEPMTPAPTGMIVNNTNNVNKNAPVVSPMPNINIRPTGMSSKQYLIEKIKQKKLMEQQQKASQSSTNTLQNVPGHSQPQNPSLHNIGLPNQSGQGMVPRDNTYNQAAGQQRSTNMSQKQMLLQKIQQQNKQ